MSYKENGEFILRKHTIKWKIHDMSTSPITRGLALISISIDDGKWLDLKRSYIPISVTEVKDATKEYFNRQVKELNK